VSDYSVGQITASGAQAGYVVDVGSYIPQEAYFRKPDGQALCGNCKTRPGTKWWSGEQLSALEFAHGCRPVAWCEMCVVTAQIEFVEKQAARLPGLRERLAELTK
jgi:hypothetical protein